MDPLVGQYWISGGFGRWLGHMPVRFAWYLFAVGLLGLLLLVLIVSANTLGEPPVAAGPAQRTPGFCETMKARSTVLTERREQS